MPKRVILFTAPGCVWCTKAEQFLKKNGIRYRKIDISKDQKAAKDCERHGCRGIPVVLIGSRWICGFNEPVIKKELEIK
jgi:glutaredoxin